MKPGILPIVCFIFIFLSSCGGKEEHKEVTTQAATPAGPALFTLLDPGTTGFDFVNSVPETNEMNIRRYEYFYNGSGVAIGDINNDQLPDILMGSNLQGGRLFLNQGGMKFRDITETAGVKKDGFTTGVAMADVNGDGFTDLYYCRSGYNSPDLRRNILLINNGDLTFTDKAREYGLDDPSFSNHANFFDYDNDGDLDVFLLNHRKDFPAAITLAPEDIRARQLINIRNTKDSLYQFHSNKLFRNNGNQTFTDVTAEAGLVSFDFGLSATAADLNQDGKTDLYVCNDYASVDHVYINQGNGSFTDRVKDMMGVISRNSMGSDIADCNNDGLPDIITCDMMAEGNYRQKQLKGLTTFDMFQTGTNFGYHNQVMRNCLQVNAGNGKFQEIGQFAGISHTDWSWSPLFADFDNDGWKDLFISNGYSRDVTDLDYVKYHGPKIMAAKGGPDQVADMDLLAVAKITHIKNYIFKNQGNHRFTKMTDNWGLGQLTQSNGAAYADLDNDGDLDLVVNNYNHTSSIYRNNSREQNPATHSVTVALRGKAPNVNAIGAKVTLSYDGKKQYGELFPNRGFFSCSQPVVHFGTGSYSGPVTLTVEWPGGKRKQIEKSVTDKIIVLTPDDGTDAPRPATPAANPIFTLSSGSEQPAWKHTESSFIDIKVEPLLENFPSRRGPHLAVADVNGDQLDDFYAGGAAGQPGALYLQQGSGTFRLQPVPAFAAAAAREDGQAVFFDADKDGDADLVVPAGSNEFSDNSRYGLRLYLNDGKGNFTDAAAQMPQVLTPCQALAALDYDGDGDEDLFAGGFALYDSFPNAAASYVLRNDNGKFVAAEVLPDKGQLGMINDVAAADFNGDGKTDLALAGWWNPVRLLINTGSGFKAHGDEAGLQQTGGMWNCLTAADLDGDGDTDLLAGNRGTNYFFRTSPQQPGTLVYTDIEGNGKKECMISYYFEDGQLYPKYSLDELANQVPAIKNRFNLYETYSKATAPQVVDPQNWDKAPKWFCHTFETVAFVNEGNGKFRQLPLPAQAQYFPVNDILVTELNGDKFPEILLVGNDTYMSVDLGRQNSGLGLLMQGENLLEWKPLTAAESGILLQGDLRQARQLRSAGSKMMVVIARNDGPLSFLRPRR